MMPTLSSFVRHRPTAALVSVALLLSSASVAFAQDAPSQPAPPKAPKAPAAPNATDPPKAPTAPTAPDMPSAPAMPKMPAPAGSTAPAITAVDDAPTPKEIWAKFIDATGGAAAFPTEGSRSTIGRILIPSAGMEGTVETLVRTPNLVLIRTTIPGIGEILQGYDGAFGWTVDPMGGERLLEPAELDPMLRAADFRGPAGYLDGAKSAKTLGTAELQGNSTWVVELTGLFGDGVTLMYFNRSDDLLSGVRMTTQSPMGEVPVESLLSDYKEFGKAKYATKTTSRAMMQEFVTTVEKVSEEEIPVEKFAPPASVKALIEAKKAGAAADTPADADAPKVPDASKAPRAPKAPKETDAPKAPKAP